MITIKFVARSFLYNQVNYGWTLKDVGAGLITPEHFKSIIKNKSRTSAGVTAPSKGLILVKINYK